MGAPRPRACTPVHFPDLGWEKCTGVQGRNMHFLIKRKLYRPSEEYAFILEIQVRDSYNRGERMRIHFQELVFTNRMISFAKNWMELVKWKQESAKTKTNFPKTNCGNTERKRARFGDPGSKMNFCRNGNELSGTEIILRETNLSWTGIDLRN